MKAEKILSLIERALNPDLKIAHIKAYGQAMIQQDRDRIKFNEGISSSIEKVIELTPIILD